MTAASPPVPVLFIGTPGFAVPCLEAIVGIEVCRVVGVVSQPDKPAGRGLKLTPSPVKIAGEQLGLPVFQPASLKGLSRAEGSGQIIGSSTELELQRLLATLSAEPPLAAAVVVAYGKIIPPALLDAPLRGVVNVHPSLLPRWRGAAPIQHAIFSGDQKTGVCLMKLDAGLDTGPVYCSEELPIHDDEDCGSLSSRLSQLGARMLAEKLPLILSGQLSPTQQSNDGVTYAEKWETEDLRINWAEPALTSVRRIRASSPEQGARTTFRGELVKIFAASITQAASGKDVAPGVIVESNRIELIVAAGSGSFVRVSEMQFPGKRRMAVAEILRGKSISAGEQFE